MKVSNFDSDNPPGELDRLAIASRTDKSSRGHGYTRWYAPLFELVKNKPLNILEIGVGNGASLKLWESFFPAANIIGLDINEKLLSLNRPRVEVRMLNAGVPLRWQQFLETPRKFDIIIDDGSHCLDDVLCAINHMWETVTPGGLYIIEDLGCQAFDSAPIKTAQDAVDAKLRWGNSFCGQMVDFHAAHDSESLTVYPSQNRHENTAGLSGQCLVVFQKKKQGAK